MTLNLTFAPHSAGTSGGSVFVSGPNLNVPLSGTGTTTTAGQLSITPSLVNFGNVNVGSTGTQAITMSATGASVTVSSDTSSGSQFVLNGVSLPFTIPAGQSLSLNVAFKPTASGTVSGSLSFTSNASNGPNLNVPLSGTGTTTAGQLSITPALVNFGNVNVGSTGTQAITMSATGASVTVSSDTSSGSQFVLNGVSLPFTIPAGQSMSYNVAFKPTASGTVSGSLSFTSNASNGPNLNVPLSGTGTTTAGQLSITPAQVNFGNVNVGSTGTQAITMSASAASVTVSSDVSSSSQFVLSGTSLPFTIPAGQSLSLNVAFKPTASGTVSGSLSFTSNASNGPNLNVPLSGTGTTTAGQLSITPAQVNFGNVNVGSTGTQAITMSASAASVTVSSDVSSSSQFVLSGTSLPFTIPAGQSLSLNVAFKPTASGTVSGSLSFTSNASNGPNLNVPLSGTGTTTAGQLSITPALVNFGNVNVGSTGTQAITMSATGASVTVSSDTSSGSQFVLNGVSLPFTIPAGQSMSYNVAFKPTASGTVSGSLSFTSNASNGPNLNVPLSGTGTTTTTTAGQLSVAPAPLNFGNVTVGTTGTQPINLSASGASVTVTSDASSNSQYVLNGAAFPLTIPAGQSVQYNVSFTPTGSGTVSGSLTFASNAATAQTIESLTGIGTVQQYSVNLSWNASTGVAGYNVYRSTSSNGTFAKINSALDANTAYTDNSVVSGQTYYYEATAVDSSGQESVRSTPPAQASIP